jgi:hypothetical protein
LDYLLGAVLWRFGVSETIERSGDQIICPLCDWEFTDSWEFNDRAVLSKTKIQCESCNEYFYLAGIDFDVTYHTEAIIEKP